MNIKIKINELGVIKNSEVEFKPFLIFSGESSVGKSYTAFLFYHLTTLFKGGLDNRLTDFVKNKYAAEIESNKNNASWKLSIKANDFVRWFNKKASDYIGYLIGNSSFKCDIELISDLKDFDIEILFPNKFSKIKSENEVVINESVTFIINGKILNTQESVFASKAHETFGALISIELRKQMLNIDTRFIPILLPPARGGIVGYNFSELTAISSTAGMYEEFIKDLDILKSPNPNKFQINKELNSLLQNIFKGEIKVKENRLEYQIRNLSESRFPITAAASSIKELSPLFLMLNKYTVNQLSILFEEPEAHLHPTMQQNVALILAYIINNGGFIQMTTHSDYLLNQINNLIRLGQLKSKSNSTFKKAIKELSMNEKLVLDEELVGAYFFERQADGSVRITNQNDLTDGVPFNSFDKAVEKMTSQTRIINSYFE
jgi:predicted ATPase